MLSSAATFGFFMSIGSVSRGGHFSLFDVERRAGIPSVRQPASADSPFRARAEKRLCELIRFLPRRSSEPTRRRTRSRLAHACLPHTWRTRLCGGITSSSSSSDGLASRRRVSWRGSARHGVVARRSWWSRRGNRAQERRIHTKAAHVIQSPSYIHSVIGPPLFPSVLISLEELALLTHHPRPRLERLGGDIIPVKLPLKLTIDLLVRVRATLGIGSSKLGIPSCTIRAFTEM